MGVRSERRRDILHALIGHALIGGRRIGDGARVRSMRDRERGRDAVIEGRIGAGCDRMQASELRLVEPPLSQAAEHGVDGDIVGLPFETTLRGLGRGVEAAAVHVQQRPAREHLGVLCIELFSGDQRGLGRVEVERMQTEARVGGEVRGVMPAAHQIVGVALHGVVRTTQLERRA